MEDKGLWVLNDDGERIGVPHLSNDEPSKNYTKLDAFQDLQDHCLEIYKVKNAKYGDSFGISVGKYGLLSALTRMSDKWNRIENLILTNDDGTEDESLIDSLLDLSNYCQMTVIEIGEMVSEK